MTYSIAIVEQSFQAEYDRLQLAQEEAEKRAKQLSADLQQSIEDLTKVRKFMPFERML